MASAAPMIVRVSFGDILSAPNAADLLHEYATECSLPELGAFSPQQDLYLQMERAGTLRSFGIYDGSLIGFACLLVYMLPHYGRTVATTESIFITRTRRQNGNGTRLLRFLEGYAREHGCAAMLYTAPVGSRFQRLLARTCRHSNSVYLKNLL